MLRTVRAVACAAASALASAAAVHVDTLAGFLARGRFTGQLRAYYFTRDYSVASTVNARAFSLAGLFNYQTPQLLDGFSLGASFYTANALGTQSNNPRRIDATLMGPTNAINALGQAFVQYSGHDALIRLGDQLIITPWAGSSDSRALPATYRAAYGTYSPVTGLTLTALRILRFKGRTADGFFQDNNYYPPTWNGDANYGGIANLPARARAAGGTLAFGAAYARSGLKASAWYYRFYGFAHMLYGEVDDTLPIHAPLEPFAGVQGVREWGGLNRFAATATGFFGQPGTAVDTLALGAIAGVKAHEASLSIAYDQLRREGRGAHLALHCRLRHRSTVYDFDDPRHGRARPGPRVEIQGHHGGVRQASAAVSLVRAVPHGLSRARHGDLLRCHLSAARVDQGSHAAQPAGHQPRPGQSGPRPLPLQSGDGDVRILRARALRHLIRVRAGTFPKSVRLR